MATPMPHLSACAMAEQKAVMLGVPHLCAILDRAWSSSMPSRLMSEDVNANSLAIEPVPVLPTSLIPWFSV